MTKNNNPKKRLLIFGFVIALMLSILGLIKNLNDEVDIYPKMIENFTLNKPFFDQIFRIYAPRNPANLLSFEENFQISCQISNYPEFSQYETATKEGKFVFIVGNSLEFIDSVTIDENRALKQYNNEILLKQYPYWSWNYFGGPGDLGYECICNYLNLTPEIIKNMKLLLEQVDCGAISVDKKSNISIFYRGVSPYYYEYYCGNFEYGVPGNYIELDSNVYCGLFGQKPEISLNIESIRFHK